MTRTVKSKFRITVTVVIALFMVAAIVGAFELASYLRNNTIRHTAEAIAEENALRFERFLTEAQKSTNEPVIQTILDGTTSLPESTRAFLLDGNGLILYSTAEKEAVGDSINSIGLGEDKLLIVESLAGSDWQVAYIFDKSVFPAGISYPLVLVLTIVGFGAFGFTMYGIANRIFVNPFERLKRTISDMESNPEESESGIGLIGDFGDMVQSIHRMTSRLREEMPFGIFFLNGQGDMTYANRRLQEQFKYDDNAGFRDVFNSNARYLFVDRLDYEAFQVRLKENKPINAKEVAFKDSTGRIFWVEFWLRPVLEPTDNLAFEGVFVDIDMRKRYELDLVSQATTDRLTGLNNRFYYDEMVAQAIALNDRNHFPLSMVMVDIDNFKTVNDNFGHDIGDSVLKSIAYILKETVRQSDVVARWGGEEFVILLDNSNQENAARVAEKIRINVEAHDFGKAGRVTISCGVAERIVAENAQEWFKRVDMCLYRAKEGGRNRVVASDIDIDSVRSYAAVYWQNAYISGNDIIDSEHKELFEMLNRLLKKVVMNDRHEAVLDGFTRIVKHLERHFQNEEAILLELGYPNMELMHHKEVHARIIASFKELLQKFRKKEIETNQIVKTVVDVFIIGHLIEEDVKYFGLTGKHSDNMI